ncbi:MAG: hypothetical protein J7496_08660 [Novosphingobium sp.]|nr:hypothetical protein [Novosphingobium sp.]
MKPRSTFGSKAPTRSYWRAQLTQWLVMRRDIETTTVADMPSWVDRLAKGEAEAMLGDERKRRSERDAA